MTRRRRSLALVITGFVVVAAGVFVGSNTVGDEVPTTGTGTTAPSTAPAPVAPSWVRRSSLEVGPVTAGEVASQSSTDPFAAAAANQAAREQALRIIAAAAATAPQEQPAPAAALEQLEAELATVREQQQAVRDELRTLSGGNPDELTVFPLPSGWTNAIEICNRTGSRVKFGIAWQNTIINSIRTFLFGTIASSGFTAAGFVEAASGRCEEIGFGFGNGPASGYLSVFQETPTGWVAHEYDGQETDEDGATAYGYVKWICWPESYASNIDPDEECENNPRNVKFNFWFQREAPTRQLRITLSDSGYAVATRYVVRR